MSLKRLIKRLKQRALAPNLHAVSVQIELQVPQRLWRGTSIPPRLHKFEETVLQHPKNSAAASVMQYLKALPEWNFRRLKAISSNFNSFHSFSTFSQPQKNKEEPMVLTVSHQLSPKSPQKWINSKEIQYLRKKLFLGCILFIVFLARWRCRDR